MPSNLNWLTLRRAGALFNLARTPYVHGTDALTDNPKKAQGNVVYDHTRKLLPDWPANSVFKIKGNGPSNVVMNKLELETVSTGYDAEASVAVANPGAWDGGLFSGYSTNFASSIWTGGDDELYETITFVWNTYTGDDAYGNPLWQIDSVELNVDGTSSSSQTTGNSAPNTSGSAFLYNGTGFGGGTNWFSEPKNTVYATFSGGVISAQDYLDTYGASTNNSPATGYFTPRSSADAGHGLKEYVILTTNGINIGELIYTYTGVGGLENQIMSYRHNEGDKGAGRCQQWDTECKWYYTPDACEDCWYAGKVVTVQITYKKAAVTKAVDPDNETMNVSTTIGTWATHSTVTQTLTLPSGHSRQQVGTTFSVPTVDGYVVAIDDLKVVSVS